MMTLRAKSFIGFLPHARFAQREALDVCMSHGEPHRVYFDVNLNVDGPLPPRPRVVGHRESRELTLLRGASERRMSEGIPR
jgi:hypothetical protein